MDIPHLNRPHNIFLIWLWTVHWNISKWDLCFVWSLVIELGHISFTVYVITWNVKTFISHPLKCRMCQNWLKWCSDPPTPTTTPKTTTWLFWLKVKLKFRDGGGGVWCQTPPTTTPKLQLDFFDLKSSWSLGVVVGGVWCQTPPLTTSNFDEKIWSFASNDIMCCILASNRILDLQIFCGGRGGWGWLPHMCTCAYMHACTCMHDGHVWLQTGRKQRNFRHFGTDFWHHRCASGTFMVYLCYSTCILSCVLIW